MRYVGIDPERYSGFAFGIGALTEVVGHIVFGEVVAHGVGLGAEVVGVAVVVVGVVGVLFLVVVAVVFAWFVAFLVVGVAEVVVFFLKCGIVEHLVAYAFGEFLHGQLHHFGEGHLKGLKLLCLYGSLRLFEFLSHYNIR